MGDGAIMEAEVVPDAPSTELASVTPLAVTTPVRASDLVERLGKIREAMDSAMQEGVDYGRIPGTDKPTLLKPGAEKLAVMFRLDVQTTHDEKWGPDDHLTVPAYTTIYDAPTGTRLGRGEGLCSTRERKYAYRKVERVCPQCGVAAIIKGKAEYGGGWVCWKKKGGCDAKFQTGDEAIEQQEVGEIDNPDLPDLWNTVIKMGRKRAIVDAVLLVTGASAIFTQDAEDLPAAAPTPEPAAEQPPYGLAVGEQQLASTRKALGYLLDCEPDANPVGTVLNTIEEQAGGYLPHFPLAMIVLVAQTVKDRMTAREETATVGEDDPVYETAEEMREREDAERLIAEAEARDADV